MTEDMTEEISRSWEAELDLHSVCHAVAEGSPMPMAAVDSTEHVIRYVNVAFCLLTGKSRHELLGKRFAGIAPCADGCLALLDGVSQTGLADKYTGREHTGTHPLYWSYTMWPVLARDHRQLGIMIQVTEAASLRDDTVAMNEALLLGSLRQHELTAAADLLNTQLQAAIAVRIKTEEALIGSEKLASAGRMASVLAHEINNPLESVVNLVYLAKTTEGLPTSVHHYLDMAEAELKRVAHITRQTLGFYRESSAPTTFEVVELLDAVVDLLQAKISSTKVIVEKQCDHLLAITAVSGELRQVLSNLLSNSLDAAGEDGRVVLRASAVPAHAGRDKRIRITVSDNGYGIDARTMPEIFEPFFTTKGDIGNGLGLWVCKQIIGKHSGLLQIRSHTQGPRKGTTISVVLPAFCI